MFIEMNFSKIVEDCVIVIMHVMNIIYVNTIYYKKVYILLTAVI